VGMDTPSINGPGTGPRVIVKGQPKQQSGFSAALSEQATDHSRATNSRRSDFREAAPAARKRVQEPDLVRLGTITTSKPTVSHLLIDHPDYRSRCWNIIHSEQNCSKAYTKIQAGTAIYMDPNTLEVRWGKEVREVTSTAASTDARALASHDRGKLIAEETHSFSTRLAEAVIPYFGKSYEEMNCYELVIHGLEALGIRYYGPGGLREKLVAMATSRGLPRNAYFNGEGLIKASGSQVYSRSVPRIMDAETDARRIMKEIDPLLRTGFILSFSTPTRGHTGIISRRDDRWTLINSGKMDNDAQIGTPSRMVGEEDLGCEVRDWCELAARRKESLAITVGRLHERKLMTFHRHSQPAVSPRGV
jgi:hypothetical protein